MAKVELLGNADAAEFCPNKPFLHILATASYTLQEEDPPVRLGGLYLFAAEQVRDDLSSTVTLTQLYRRKTPGIFDLKWRPYDDGPPCLAQASADGSLRLHTLSECHTHSLSSSSVEDSILELDEMTTMDISTSMCLYVDWSPSCSNPQVALSHSDGSISVIALGESDLDVTASWKAHDFEAWIVSYDAWKPQIVYSGGDDSQFCGWDLREDPRYPLFRDKKTHKMGVCSIQSNPLQENILISGSYDESIRLWDLRMIQKPLLKAELGLGGGVWRLKWHYSDKELILAACMHNGFAIARIREGEIQILEEYKEHISLAYGCSWYRGNWEDGLGSSKDRSGACQVVEVTGDPEFFLWNGTNSGLEQSKPMTGNEEISQLKETEPKLKGTDMTPEDYDNKEGFAVKLRQLDMDSNLHSQSRITALENSGGIKNLVATCSFYDKALHLWLPKTLALSPS